MKAFATKGCGWTREQLEVIGAGKQHAGWMNRVVGKWITPEQRDEFERLAQRRQENLAKAPASGDSTLGKFYNYMNLIEACRARLGFDANAKAKTVVRRVAGEMNARCPAGLHGKVSLLRGYLGYDRDDSPKELPAIAPATAQREKRQRARAQRRQKGYWGDPFFDSREWQELRYAVLKHYGRKCMLCGATSGEMHVDHIKPRSKYPLLALEFSNLQVLCRPCNLGKSNTDETDWRAPEDRSIFFVELDDPDRAGAKLN